MTSIRFDGIKLWKKKVNVLSCCTFHNLRIFLWTPNVFLQWWITQYHLADFFNESSVVDGTFCSFGGNEASVMCFYHRLHQLGCHPRSAFDRHQNILRSLQDTRSYLQSLSFQGSMCGWQRYPTHLSNSVALKYTDQQVHILIIDCCCDMIPFTS